MDNSSSKKIFSAERYKMLKERLGELCNYFMITGGGREGGGEGE